MNTLENILNTKDGKWLFYDDENALRSTNCVISDELYSRHSEFIRKKFIFDGLYTQGLSLTQKYQIFESLTTQCSTPIILSERHPDYALYKEYCIDTNNVSALFFMGEFHCINITRTKAVSLLRKVGLSHVIKDHHFHQLHHKNVKKASPLLMAHTFFNQAHNAYFWLKLLEHLSLLDDPNYSETVSFLIETTENLMVLCDRDQKIINNFSDESLMKIVGNYYAQDGLPVSHIEKIPLPIRVEVFYDMWNCNVLLYTKIIRLSRMFPELMSQICIDPHSHDMTADIEQQFNNLVLNKNYTRASYIQTLSLLGLPTKHLDNRTFISECLNDQINQEIPLIL